MFVSGHASGQDFGDNRIGNDGKAVVDGSGCGSILQIVYFAEGQHEGEHALLVIEQDFA